MRNRFIRLAAALLWAAVVPLASTQNLDVAGVKVEPTVQVGTSRLMLNGAGLRTLAIFKVYVAALYVPRKSTDAATLFEQKGARRMDLVFLRDIDAATFAAELIEGLACNHTEVQLQALKSQVAALNASVAGATGWLVKPIGAAALLKVTTSAARSLT